VRGAGEVDQRAAVGESLSLRARPRPDHRRPTPSAWVWLVDPLRCCRRTGAASCRGQAAPRNQPQRTAIR
jgi:hypothetical protein